MKLSSSLLLHHHQPFLFVFLLLYPGFPSVHSSYHDYSDALSKSILFFEGQRSGFLPQNQRIGWRANSGLSDGWMYNTDLTGGYYDAGDNVKFGFPMAFTTTMLSWSVIEFGDIMPPNELRNALVAIRWATDYLLKTVSQPNRIFVQVLISKFTLPTTFIPLPVAAVGSGFLVIFLNSIGAVRKLKSIAVGFLLFGPTLLLALS